MNFTKTDAGTKKPVIKGLQDAVLVDSRVFAKVRDAKVAAELELDLNGARVGFAPCTEPPEHAYDLSSRQQFDLSGLSARVASTPPEEERGEIFACWVNELTDWAMSNSETIQIMLVNRDQPCTIALNTVAEVTVTDRPMVFRAYLATHRGQASLRVMITNQNSGATSTQEIPFELGARGGQRQESYHAINVPLPRQPGVYSVAFEADYLGYVDDETGTEPFLFIANPRVTSQTNTPALLIPVRASSDSVAKSEADGLWVEARVPAQIVASSILNLRRGNQKLPLYRGRDTAIQLVENFGHTLILSSEETINALVCIDGIPQFKTVISENNTVVRIPSKHLNGTVRHVAVKDETGTQTLFETMHLMPNILTPQDVLQRESSAPFPGPLFPQAAHRYASLKAQMHHAGSTTDLAQLGRALDVLEGGYDNAKLAPLNFPVHDKPDVSIVIPAHNKSNVTYLALCSLLLAYNEATFEVIVVDDASTDDTAELEQIVSGITVIHNETAQRFIRACNAGVDKARGTYVLLLNNDVEVTAGWLDALIDAFKRFDNVGLVGSKLLYPNGELQDAGGIIWGTGNPWNYGNRQNPDDPRFCYARQADYLSGAAMMTTRKIWDQVGGLSSYLEPMYFEDTDFSFKVRDAGYSTWFVPSSVVYHYEGMTSGTDVTAGYKRFQEVNRPKFKRQWAKAYAGFGTEGHRPDLEKDRGILGRVLFTDYTTPRPDQDAGSYAAVEEMRLVQSLGYKVTFLPVNLAHFGSYTTELQKQGIEVIHAPFFLSLEEYLERHAKDFDAVYITRYYVAQDVLGHIRRYAPHAKILFNNADLHFLREIRTARALGDEAQMIRARETRDQELDVMNRVDVVLSYNDVEHSVIEAFTEGRAKVTKCPWVVELPAKVPGLKSRRGMSFLGGFRHHPNVEGITWFAREVMPRITARVPDARLTIYGSGMGDDIKALASDAIDPAGFVADLADAYDAHRIFVAPLLSGAGIKGKVLSALAHGIPCVLSPTAAEGIGLRHGHDCFVAKTPDEWAEAIATLSSDDAVWQSMSDNARAYVKESFSFEVGRDAMKAAFEAADLYRTLD